ncbi:hypothetical protein MMC11_003410 [Xylographa trunciseda]|nr:hypothetical protein [Xylographa trunciseda]
MKGEEFKEALWNAASAAHPRYKTPSRYKGVYVLLLSWVDDNTNVREGIEELHKVFRDQYHFKTEEWQIPRDNSFVVLGDKLRIFRETPQEADMPNEEEKAGGKEVPENKDFLRIVYYAGRSRVKNVDRCYWLCDDKPSSQYVDWSIFETQFGQSDADVLILLDCYNRTSFRETVGSNITEIISSSNWEMEKPPSTGDYSFTRALCEVLKDLSSGPPFSVVMLHQHVFSRCPKQTVDSKPFSIIPRYKLVEPIKTPTYGSFTREHGQRSIVIRNNSQGLSIPISSSHGIN